MNKNANYQSPITVRTAIEAQKLLMGSPAADINGSGGSTGGNTDAPKW